MKQLVKKPAIVISSYDDLDNPSYGGGGAVAIHEVAKRLSRDYTVTVLTGMFPGARKNIIRSNVRYLRIGSPVFGARFGHLLFSAHALFYALCLKYDLWIDSFTPPFSVSLLPLAVRKPVIGLVHMLAAEDMERKYNLPFGIVEQAGLKLYRSFIVLNNAVHKKIANHNPDAAITRITNGVTIPDLTNKTVPEHILFMGRIEVNQKGLDLLLKAYAAAKAKIGYPLVIAGAGTASEMSKLKTLIGGYGLTGDVILAGRVAAEEKDMLLKKSVCVVCPSRFETFPLIALEAMAYKKCLVSFDIDGVNWIPAGHSMKVAAFDVEELSDALVSVVRAPRRVLAIGERAAHTARRYSWDMVAQKVAGCIDEALERQAAGAWLYNFK